MGRKDNGERETAFENGCYLGGFCYSPVPLGGRGRFLLSQLLNARVKMAIDPERASWDEEMRRALETKPSKVRSPLLAPNFKLMVSVQVEVTSERSDIAFRNSSDTMWHAGTIEGVTEDGEIEFRTARGLLSPRTLEPYEVGQGGEKEEFLGVELIGSAGPFHHAERGASSRGGGEERCAFDQRGPERS